MFEILEHTADIGIRARGATLTEVFEQAALALEHVVLDPAGVEPREQYAIEAYGEDNESLLVNFLSEVLYLLDAKRVAFSSIRLEGTSSGAVHAMASGEPRDARRHPPRVIVKGVTYHQIRLEETPDGWVAEVFLDI